MVMTSMTADWTVIWFPSLETVTELHVTDREQKEGKANCDEKNVAHVYLISLVICTGQLIVAAVLQHSDGNQLRRIAQASSRVERMRAHSSGRSHPDIRRSVPLG